MIDNRLIHKHRMDSMRLILDILTEVDPEIMDTFPQIGEHIINELPHLDEEIGMGNKGNIIKDRLNRILDDGLKKSGQRVNIIPEGNPDRCQRIGYASMIDKWGSTKGFNGICKKLITYWLKCSKTNRTTIILTTAWDEIDFSQNKVENYRERFDSYASEHNIIVILISLAGFSICYMK